MQRTLGGLWPPVATAFDDDGGVDSKRLVQHSRRLLAAGASGLAILGTTSEANSLTLAERRNVIDAHLEAGIAADRLLPGTGACAIDDVVALTRHAGEVGAAGVLMLPPFYYKQVSDDGLFAFVARVIERTGAKIPRIVLYHIPPIAVVGWSLDLVRRLIDAFPGIVAGMKDSSGDFEHTRQAIDAFPELAVFPGAEVYLVKALAAGAAGCISATANVNAGPIAALIENWQEADAERRQAELNTVRQAVASRGMIAGIKAVLAARYGEASWLNVRPPLTKIDEAARAGLLCEPAIAALLEAAPA